MRLTPSDPDIETIYGRIVSGATDLQPDFQRGEIWGTAKKQRLIDSILRDWHIPPIHVIIEPTEGKQLVLDGQQRLAAIRDFKAGHLRIDGRINPIDSKIVALDGLTYDLLPPEWKNLVDQFTIRVFRITDYSPSEPGELFFRLNQLSALTAAEQRNAFFGIPRRQIKDLVEYAASVGLDSNFWGFANVRMAYDDVLTRVAVLLDERSLKKRITSSALADRFRNDEAFSELTLSRLRMALSILGKIHSGVGAPKEVRLNKATAQSWLLFLSSITEVSSGRFTDSNAGAFFFRFEEFRLLATLGELEDQMLSRYLVEYSNRSSYRVADVSSVQIRDLVLWMMCIHLDFLPLAQTGDSRRGDVKALVDLIWNRVPLESSPDHLVEELSWGSDL